MPELQTSISARRWLLQLVLCLIFASTLGLAFLVTKLWTRQSRIALSDKIESVGRLHFRMPMGWSLQSANDGVVLEEPAAHGRAGRRIQIWLARNDSLLSPLECLVRNGDLRIQDINEASRASNHQGAAALRSLSIGGWPGVEISQTRLFLSHDRNAGQRVSFKQILACATLPCGEAIILRLDGEGNVDSADEQLIESISALCGIEKQSAPERIGQVALDYGIKANLPELFQGSSQRDDFHSDQWLTTGDAVGWIGIDLVPVVILPGEQGDLLRSLLMMRDPFFRPTQVERSDENTWVCHRSAVGLFPAVGYLREGPEGLGLLVEIRWSDPAASKWVEDMMPMLLAGISFPDHADVVSRIQPSAAARAQLIANPAGWLPESYSKESWQYYQDASSWVVPATVEYVPAAGLISGARACNQMGPLGNLSGQFCKWSAAADLSNYELSLRRFGPAAVFSQETHLQKGKISTRVYDGTFLAQSSEDNPSLFIPGPLLPLVVGHLPAEPLVFRTDSTDGPQAELAPTLMTVLLQPDTQVSKALAPSTQPMTCWLVQINGSGRICRWYFDTNRQLHSVDFAGGIHFVRQPPADPMDQP